MNSTDGASIFTEQVAELVAIGAALGSNCQPCLRWHHKHARELGVSDEDMARAVALAQMVKERPAELMLQLAGRLGIGNATGADAPSCCESDDAPCCCADDDEDGCCEG